MENRKSKIDQIKYVVDNSDYVKINYDKLNDFTDEITDTSYEHWFDNKELKLNEKQRILLMFLLESINFCFWQKPKFNIDYKNKRLKGSEALFMSIIKEVEKDINFLNIENLNNLTKEEFYEIFKTPYGPLSLKDTRYKVFKNTIQVIYDKKDNFYKELFSLNCDSELLNYIKDNFKYFRDISNYKGVEVHIDKRASLLVNDLFRVSDTINKNIKNVDNLTGCADYVIPKVLRAYGVLVYNKELSNIVDDEIEIDHDSNMEIEIRVNMLYVIELIKEKLQNKNININSIELDNIIWKTGRKKEISSPNHHTTCIYY